MNTFLTRKWLKAVWDNIQIGWVSKMPFNLDDAELADMECLTPDQAKAHLSELLLAATVNTKKGQ